MARFANSNDLKSFGIHYLTRNIPRQLDRMLGYAGDGYLIGFYYDVRLDSLLIMEPGKLSFNGNWVAFDVFLSHVDRLGPIDVSEFLANPATLQSAARGFLFDRDGAMLYVAQTENLFNFFGLMLSGADSTPRIDMRMVEDRPNGELWVPDEFRDGVEAMQSWVKQRQEPVRQQVA